MTHAPLRIALVLETSGGGSGRHVLDLAKGCVSRGHDVTVIWSPKRAAEDFTEALHAIAGLTTQELEMDRPVGLSDFTSFRAMTALFRSLAPFDIIHAHSSKAGALTRMLPRRISGKRIYTPHAFRTMDPDLGSRPRAVYGMIERGLARWSDKIIAVSRAEHDHAVSLGIDAAKVRVVVNGADLPDHADRTKARQDMGLAEDDIAIGFIGRLEAQKDPLRFVTALGMAAQNAPNLRGVVIGDGSLCAAAEAKNTGGSVSFTGWQDGPALILGLDIFAMTSRYEAMPYTLLEALHAGIPIITSDVGGAYETVEDGVNGFTLPIDATPEAFATCFETLANDAQQRADFGAKSHALATQRTIDVMTDQTIALYQELTA